MLLCVSLKRCFSFTVSPRKETRYNPLLSVVGPRGAGGAIGISSIVQVEKSVSLPKNAKEVAKKRKNLAEKTVKVLENLVKSVVIGYHWTRCESERPVRTL